ncbi:MULTISPECIES: MFS transporter [Streptomyces]|uniref:MFS transporter n=1 Tax=Streptomyces xanthochromogenes TaxID=67384 RepID=A0ABQ2ZFG0_9ACTN|nr:MULTISPECIES: MFS transporter [Streptomyces]GGY13637.1 MFS transporter [Streptomyces xanthochromogenes]
MTTASPTRTPGRPGASPTGRSLVCLLAGEGASYAGSSVHKVALPTLAVLSLGVTPGQVALLGVAATVPALVVTLPAGVLLDRFPLRAVLVTTDLAAVVVAAAIPAAAALDVLTLPLLYAIALALGSLSVLHRGASMAAIPLLAVPGKLHRANASFTAVITVAGVTGSALGTVLIALTGPARALIADAASFVVSACCALLVRPLAVPRRAPRGPQPMLDGIREGLHHAAQDRVLRPLFVTLTATGIGTSLTATLLAYHLLTTVRVGTTGLGLIMAAGSLGGLTGALLAPRLVCRYGAGTVLTVGFVIHALMQIPQAAADPGRAWLVILALGSYGQFAAATCVGTTQRTVQQWHTPEHLRARVQQTALWLSTGSGSLAALTAGGLAALTSVRTVMLTGVVVLLLFAGTLWRSPVRRLAARDEGDT